MCFSSVVIDYLQHTFSQDDDIAIAFIYCDYKAEQTVSHLLGSLLQQLVQQSSKVSDEIVACHQQHIQQSTIPLITEYSRLLHVQLFSQPPVFSRVFVVIDALDECGETTREILLSELRKLQSTLCLLVTTRPHFMFALSHAFEKACVLEIRASAEDIERYVQARIDTDVRLKRLLGGDPILQAEVITTIVSKAQGMFEPFVIPSLLTVLKVSIGLFIYKLISRDAKSKGHPRDFTKIATHNQRRL